MLWLTYFLLIQELSVNYSPLLLGLGERNEVKWTKSLFSSFTSYFPKHIGPQRNEINTVTTFILLILKILLFRDAFSSHE